jgi:hypothetical protein
MADTTDASSETSVAENSDVPETTTNVEDIPTIHTSPIVLDWRDKGVGIKVFPLFVQSICLGIDWAIVAATNMKANYKIQKRKLFDFSAQQLIDCCINPTYYSHGCWGGDPAEAYRYAIDWGMMRERDYGGFRF